MSTIGSLETTLNLKLCGTKMTCKYRLKKYWLELFKSFINYEILQGVIMCATIHITHRTALVYEWECSLLTVFMDSEETPFKKTRDNKLLFKSAYVSLSLYIADKPGRGKCTFEDSLLKIFFLLLFFFFKQRFFCPFLKPFSTHH